MAASHFQPRDAFLEFELEKGFDDFSLDCGGVFGSGVTAVFGPSGSGKTTLLNCISGMISPDSGEIMVDGGPVYSSARGMDLAPEKRRFGYVFQEGALFPNLTVGSNISYGYRLTPERERRFTPDELAEMLGLSHLMDRGVGNLSGGERQRVALARALATSPRLLLLDEPLSSLDAPARASILTNLRQIAEQLGTPMVFVSHSLSEVLALAPNTFAIDRGRTVAYGPTAEVMAHENVARIADYGTLENMMRAEVLQPESAGSTSRLRIGGVDLVGPPSDAQPGETVTVSIRAGDVILSLEVPPMMSARNAVPAVITDLREAGGLVIVYLDLGGRFVVEVTPAAASELNLRPGQDVYLVVKSNSILVFRSDADLRAS